MELDLALIIVAGLALVTGLASTALKRLWLSGPLIALVAGVVLGPEVLGVIHFAEPDGKHLLEELARITLAISLVATGLQFRRSDVRENGRRAGLLLTLGMAGMFAVTALGAWLIIGLPFWLALLLGAILTPTDPVVASTLVTGDLAERNLPRRLRRSLQLEAGANDGLAVAFVLLPLIVLTEASGEGGVFAFEVVKQVGLAVLVGGALGLLTALVVNLVEEGEGLEQSSLLLVGIALGLLTLGTVHALGGSGILGSFIAGLTLSLVLEERYADELEQVQGSVERLMLVPVFVLFGTLLPWSAWSALGWLGVGFAAWVLLLRRPPVVPLALAASDTPRRETAFLAWFGPLGVAAIYYVLFAESYGIDGYEEVFAAATLAIAVSVVVHSVTATPAVRRFAGRSATVTLREPFKPQLDDRRP